MDDHESVKQFFDTNVTDYESKHYSDQVRSFMLVRQRRVLEFVDSLALSKGSMVLDAGCGPGYLLEALSQRDLQVSGLDASQSMIRRTEARLTAARPAFPVTLKVGNIEQLPFPANSFDLITSTGVIEYLPNDINVLAEMFRILRPNGHLILPVTNFWSPVNYLDGAIERLKRWDWFRQRFNLVWQRLGNGPLLPRHFTVRKHRPRDLRRSLAESRFALVDDIYFYFLPLPRPLDRLLPNFCATLGEYMDKHLARSWAAPLAEGYLTISKKRVD